jgi:hypothetical protein
LFINSFLTIKDEDMKRLIQNSKYLSHGNQNELASLSLWIVCDPDTESGRQLLLDAVEFHVCSII